MWKSKEKEISVEEATALAKQELAPFWFGSSPLLVGVFIDEKYIAVPLEESFNKKPWLLFFIDMTDFSSETLLLYSQEWHRRYHQNNLGVLMIAQPLYS